MQTATPTSPRAASIDAPDLRVFVIALFFIFGGITSLNDILIPKLKELFILSHAQAMLVQSAFFAAYFIVSLPAAALIKRFGYMRAAVTGLLELVAGLRRRGDASRRDWMIVGGLTVVLAIVMLLIPADPVLAVGLLGAYAVIIGVYLAIAGLSLRWSSDSRQEVTGG